MVSSPLLQLIHAPWHMQVHLQCILLARHCTVCSFSTFPLPPLPMVELPSPRFWDWGSGFYFIISFHWTCASAWQVPEQLQTCEACGWVTGRVGESDVLPIQGWVSGFNPRGSWAPNLHLQPTTSVRGVTSKCKPCENCKCRSLK